MMTEQSRTKNSTRNIYTAVISNMITILTGFITRTLIIYRFGIEYVGVSGLFSSIITVLNFSELGFSSAIVMSMYAPLATGDTERVNALLAFYRRVYHIIGVIILAVGLVITPFLPLLVKNNTDVDINLYVLYLLNLANTVASYFLFAYRSSMLEAAQRQDLTRKAGVITNIITTIIQIIIAFTVDSFYLFTAVMIIGTVIGNVIAAYYSGKYFPQYRAVGTLDKISRKSIYDQVKGIALIRLGEISRNAFDSIVISFYLGLNAVGMYGNYYYVYHGVFNGMSIISGAIQASVGNSIATESVEKNYHDMIRFQFIFSVISAWAFNCMLVCYQPFMKVWAGKNNMLPMSDVILFCIYFYIMSLTSIRNLYVNGKGLWWSLRYITIAEAAGNLILNFILGKFFGIAGVLAASIITMLIFNYFMVNRRLFREYFRIGELGYYRIVGSTTIVTTIVAIINYGLCNMIGFDGVTGFLVNLLIASGLSAAAFCLVYRRTAIYSESLMLLKRMVPSRQ